MSHGLMVRLVGNRMQSPGPAAYNNRRKTGDDTPKWSIKNRYPQKIDVNNAPYNTIESTVGKVPKISMKGRIKELPRMITPGPNYVPPRLGHDSRKITVAPKYSQKKMEITPGPGAYTPKIEGDSAKYTMQGKNYAPDSKVFSPGPAAYSPDYSKSKPSARSATIGNRINDPSIQVTPGPSDYEVSRDLGGPSATMHIRPKDSNKEVTPGPSDYVHSQNNTAPSFTIGNRIEQKLETNQAGYVNLPSTVGEGPKITMTSRHEPKTLENTPGPNYVPPVLGSDAPKIGVGNRYNDVKKDVTPGPGQYDMPQEQTTSILIKGRTPIIEPGASSPGPAAYSPDYVKLENSLPPKTIGLKLPERPPEQTPGFVNLPSTLQGPAYTIGNRESCDVAIL